MAIDMNVDVGALIKGLFSKKTSQGEAKAPQNPYVKTLISIVTVIILIASYIYFIYLPTQEELRINNEKLNNFYICKYIFFKFLRKRQKCCVGEKKTTR